MSEDQVNTEGAVCAPTLPHEEQIVMGHGAGGRMSHRLIQKAFLPAFDNAPLQAGDDAARLVIHTPLSLGSRLRCPLER